MADLDKLRAAEHAAFLRYLDAKEAWSASTKSLLAALRQAEDKEPGDSDGR